jgi:hypothetical protein
MFLKQTGSKRIRISFWNSHGNKRQLAPSCTFKRQTAPKNLNIHWLPKYRKNHDSGCQLRLLATGHQKTLGFGSPIKAIGYRTSEKIGIRVANKGHWLPPNRKNRYLGRQYRPLATGHQKTLGFGSSIQAIGYRTSEKIGIWVVNTGHWLPDIRKNRDLGRQYRPLATGH